MLSARSPMPRPSRIPAAIMKVTRQRPDCWCCNRPRGKDLADKKELMQVRHFLERSVIPAPRPAMLGTHSAGGHRSSRGADL